jgi:hypothetical protein
VEPNPADPLQLKTLIGERLEELGYVVLPKTPARDGLVLSYDYGTAPALTEEGQISRRLQWFRVRLVDSAAQGEVASGELMSGILDQVPEDKVAALITALGKRLQGSRQNPVGGAEKNMNPEPAKQDDPRDSVLQLQTKKEPKNPSSQPLPETNRQREKSSSPAETAPGNPWLPRLKSWGFEEWGKEK